MALEQPAKEGNSPVDENLLSILDRSLEYRGERLPRGNPGVLHSQG